ncbi:MAG: haloacid dehalogenase-like hydrolase [Atopobiaceae bacterium]|nr:haloacid dehalogenase-like hydrolase [Atopobiaceae bacterium]
MEGEKKTAGTWRIVAIVAICACAVLAVLYATKPSAPANDATTEAASADASATEASTNEGSAQLTLVEGEDPLSLWSDDAPLKKKLVDYVEAATDESSADFVPVEDRIATFDFDGTLFCETDPNYFDYTMLVYRVTQDPDYIDKASDFEKATAAKIIDQNENGTKYDELPLEHGQCIASAFKGMTVDEFYDYVHEFMKTDMPSYTGMKRGGGFYQPMVQVVQYLQANDFDVYVMSGTDRLIMRGIFSADTCPIKLPLDHVMGSDETLVGSNQGDADGLDYTFGQDEKLVTGGTFLMKTLKENKCYIIQREVAKQPVLSFGNSSGDFAMDNYALSNPTYKSAAFQLCCDDLERENGNTEKAESMLKDCEDNGYVPVSMKNDWKTIYGDGVTYTGAKAEVEVAEAA